MKVFAINAVVIGIFETVLKLVIGPFLRSGHGRVVAMVALFGLLVMIMVAAVVEKGIMSQHHDPDAPDESFMMILALPFIFGAMVGFWFLI
jgi:hypothetical protein